MASACTDTVDVLIIGGGWSGLLACKYAKEEDLSVTVLEGREGLGGVWRYSDDVNITTVMRNTRSSSSSTVTEMSDFPMPDEIGEFPKHAQVIDYLEDYASKFDLRRHIRFNSKVESTKKHGNEWWVQTEDSSIYHAKNLVICSGVYHKINDQLKDTLLSDFDGEVIHAGQLKKFDERHSGKRVMIIGGGETASDIVCEYHEHAQNIIWCIPNGQHFFRKYAKILPHRKAQALDKASSRALKLIAPHTKSKPGLAWVCHWTTNGSLTAYQGHGIPEWRNEAPFFHSFINKHGHVLDVVDYKKVIPKGQIEKVTGKTVYFTDESVHEVDLIILCTGYQVDFPFLPQEYRSTDRTRNYKYVFNVKDPSLSFIGYVRPVVGSIPGIAEAQARWVCRTISGRVSLPDKTSMLHAVEADRSFWKKYFQQTSGRIGTLVEAYTYLDDIAQLSDSSPNYWQLFKDSPRDWFDAYFAPYNGCSLVLGDPKKRAQAMETLRKHSSDTINPTHLLLILLLRFLMFDWFLDILGHIKYKIQINPVWKSVREHTFIQTLDHLWTAPKRYAFDNKTKLD